MAYEYVELLIMGLMSGFVRNMIGYIKAKLKHGESFSVTKFVAALTWGTGVGISLPMLQKNIFDLPPFQIVLMIVAAVVIIDELFQAIFLRRLSGKKAASSTKEK